MISYFMYKQGNLFEENLNGGGGLNLSQFSIPLPYIMYIFAKLIIGGGGGLNFMTTGKGFLC